MYSLSIINLFTQKDHEVKTEGTYILDLNFSWSLNISHLYTGNWHNG